MFPIKKLWFCIGLSCFLLTSIFMPKIQMSSFICKLQHSLALEHLKYNEIVPEIYIKNATTSVLNTFFLGSFLELSPFLHGSLVFGGSGDTKKAKHDQNWTIFVFSWFSCLRVILLLKNLDFSKMFTFFHFLRNLKPYRSGAGIIFSTFIASIFIFNIRSTRFVWCSGSSSSKTMWTRPF